MSTRSEEIEGVHILVFQQKMEGDLWTTYAAFPGRDVAVVASNRDYLRTVLTRRKNGTKKRALPDSLPEWRFINRNAPYFGSFIGSEVMHDGACCCSSPCESGFGFGIYFPLGAYKLECIHV